MDYSDTLRKQGFAVVRGLLDPKLCDSFKKLAQEHLKQRITPLELEADLQYAGAPTSREESSRITASVTHRSQVLDTSIANVALPTIAEVILSSGKGWR
ncbi:hypothetical protein BGZ92_002898 [Podila epicladia]|nr:hypothetical protein BGZ92_002898 [Podila epicladia]